MFSLAILGGELKDRYASVQPSEGRSGTSLARLRRNGSSAVGLGRFGPSQFSLGTSLSQFWSRKIMEAGCICIRVHPSLLVLGFLVGSVLHEPGITSRLAMHDPRIPMYVWGPSRYL